MPKRECSKCDEIWKRNKNRNIDLPHIFVFVACIFFFHNIFGFDGDAVNPWPFTDSSSHISFYSLFVWVFSMHNAHRSFILYMAMHVMQATGHCALLLLFCFYSAWLPLEPMVRGDFWFIFYMLATHTHTATRTRGRYAPPTAAQNLHEQARNHLRMNLLLLEHFGHAINIIAGLPVHQFSNQNRMQNEKILCMYKSTINI